VTVGVEVEPDLLGRVVGLDLDLLALEQLLPLLVGGGAGEVAQVLQGGVGVVGDAQRERVPAAARSDLAGQAGYADVDLGVLALGRDRLLFPLLRCGGAGGGAGRRGARGLVLRSRVAGGLLVRRLRGVLRPVVARLVGGVLLVLGRGRLGRLLRGRFGRRVAVVRPTFDGRLAGGDG